MTAAEILLTAAGGAVLALTVPRGGLKPQPEYETLRKLGRREIRAYAPFWVLEITAPYAAEDGGSTEKQARAALIQEFRRTGLTEGRPFILRIDQGVLTASMTAAGDPPANLAPAAPILLKKYEGFRAATLRLKGKAERADPSSCADRLRRFAEESCETQGETTATVRYDLSPFTPAAWRREELWIPLKNA